MYKVIFLMCITLISFGVSAADINAGKGRSASCVGCHGATGISSVPMYPNLSGQKSLYLEKQLKAFRDGGRQDPMMSSITKALNDKDISDLAAYYSSLNK